MPFQKHGIRNGQLEPVRRVAGAWCAGRPVGGQEMQSTLPSGVAGGATAALRPAGSHQRRGTHPQRHTVYIEGRRRWPPFHHGHCPLAFKQWQSYMCRTILCYILYSIYICNSISINAFSQATIMSCPSGNKDDVVGIL